VVVVSLVVEGGGATTTAGGLTTVFLVTVWLLTLGATGAVVVVVSDSVVSCARTLPAPIISTTPRAAAEIPKLDNLIFRASLRAVPVKRAGIVPACTHRNSLVNLALKCANTECLSKTVNGNCVFVTDYFKERDVNTFKSYFARQLPNRGFIPIRFVAAREEIDTIRPDTRLPGTYGQGYLISVTPAVFEITFPAFDGWVHMRPQG
jgi:hypothetical protein